MAEQIEIGRCEQCGAPISRVKASEWVARLGSYRQPASEWRHNSGVERHRPTAVPSSVRDLLTR